MKMDQDLDAGVFQPCVFLASFRWHLGVAAHCVVIVHLGRLPSGTPLFWGAGGLLGRYSCVFPFA